MLGFSTAQADRGQRNLVEAIRGGQIIVKFGYYLLNTYVPELDGESPELYARWLSRSNGRKLGFDSLWVTEHHFRYFGGMMPSPSVLLAAAPSARETSVGCGGVDSADAQSSTRR